MKLSVPLNWDIRLIDSLRDGSYPISDLYAALPEDLIGSGRPSVLIPSSSSRRMAARAVKRLHSLGFKFTYLLNSPCLDNLEYTKDFQKDINDHLKWLVDIGTDCVTVTIPYLIELVKQRFPSLKIRVSVIARVNTIERAKFYESLGADELTVCFMSNRDFPFLKDLAKQSKLRLSLIVNDICLYQCPMQSYHRNLVGHASQNHHASKGFYIDYCMLRCALARLNSPEEIIKSRWIRPEDLKIYEQETGIDNFKIAGRGSPTEWILHAVKAYSNGAYPGNLLDLMDAHESTGSASKNSPFFKRLIRLIRFVLPLPIKIYRDIYLWFTGQKQMPDQIYVLDNSVLNGFLDFFVHGSCTQNCHACDHCNNLAQKAIKYNERKREYFIGLYSSVLKKLTNGSYFK